MAETLLPVCSQQGSSLPQSWNGNSLHGWDTLAQGAVWRLGQTQTSLQPHGEVRIPLLQIPVHSATLLFPAGNGAEPEQPSVTVPTKQLQVGFPPVQVSQDWCLQGTVLSWGKTRGGWPLSRLSPAQDKVLCVGDDTCHLHSTTHRRRAAPCGPYPRQGQAHLPLRRQKGSSCTGTRMVLKMGRYPSGRTWGC